MLFRSDTVEDVAADSEVTTDWPKMAKKVKGRKLRVLVGYKLSSVLFACAAVCVMVSKLLAEASQPFRPFDAIWSASGFVLGSGTAAILASATENDRLQSDTYKRLNLLSVCFGCQGLATQLLVAGFGYLGLTTHRMLFDYSPHLFVAAYLISTINSIKGYGYGVRGWTLRERTFLSCVSEFLRGTKKTFQKLCGDFFVGIGNTLRGFFVQSANPQSASYQ